jgi:hypothetical protein
MSKTLGAIALMVTVLGFAGCSGKKAATAPGNRSSAAIDPVAELTALRDELCACQTSRCAEAVAEKLNTLGEKYGDTKVSDADGKQAELVMTDIGECMAKLMGGPEDERVSPSNN